MCFMPFETVAFFVPSLPLQVSRSIASAGHVSTSWNWTDWKLQNQNLSFPQKHPSRRFFLPSLSFDTHSSYISSLCHQGEAENPIYFSTISLILFQKPLIPNSNLQFSIFSPFSSQSPNHLNPIVPISSPLRIEDSVNSNLQFSIFSHFFSPSYNHLNLIMPISSPVLIEDNVKIYKISHIWKCKPLIENLNLNFCCLWKLWRTKWSASSKHRLVKKTGWGGYVLIEILV